MHIFDTDINLNEQEPLHFKGTVSDNWSVNGTPNGGYLMAVLANAMLKSSNKKSTPIVTSNFISRCAPGDADLTVEEVARSTQFNRFQARLLQDGKEKIRALGTFLDEKIECVLDRYESQPPAMAPLDACIPIPIIPKFTLMDNLDIRLDPACAGWMQGNLTDKSEQRGWIKFKDGRPFDMVSVFLVVDAFPPPIFATEGMAAWVPTIEMSVNIRHNPDAQWLKGYFRTRFITCGLVEEDGEVWDEEGNLVAISRQIAQFRKIG